MFKNSRLPGAVCAVTLAVLSQATMAAGITYSSTPGSAINLDPADGCAGGTVGCFSFTPGPNMGPNISIDSPVTAQGFSGGITGTFGVGAISTNGPVEIANVVGTGSLSLFDGSQLLTADLSWIDIATFGTAGNLNTVGSANLSNIAYAGSNPDLVSLASTGSGVNTASFQFSSPVTLTGLFETSSSITSTSFSGSIVSATPVPAPAAVWLLGSGLLGLVGVARRKHTA